jgi:hypothetical protein
MIQETGKLYISMDMISCSLLLHVLAYIDEVNGLLYRADLSHENFLSGYLPYMHSQRVRVFES